MYSDIINKTMIEYNFLSCKCCRKSFPFSIKYYSSTVISEEFGEN